MYQYLYKIASPLGNIESEVTRVNAELSVSDYERNAISMNCVQVYDNSKATTFNGCWDLYAEVMSSCSHNG